MRPPFNRREFVKNGTAIAALQTLAVRSAFAGSANSSAAVTAPCGRMAWGTGNGTDLTSPNSHIRRRPPRGSRSISAHPFAATVAVAVSSANGAKPAGRSAVSVYVPAGRFLNE